MQDALSAALKDDEPLQIVEWLDRDLRETDIGLISFITDFDIKLHMPADEMYAFVAGWCAKRNWDFGLYAPLLATHLDLAMLSPQRWEELRAICERLPDPSVPMQYFDLQSDPNVFLVWANP